LEKRFLGDTNLEVTRLCFGGLTMGPSQVNLSVDDGAELISYAINSGINFIDTAELYGTYDHIREGIKKSKKFDTIVATKSYAFDKDGAEKSFEMARKKLDRDVIDIFLMHEQESIHTLNGHREAYEFYLNEKAKGKIRAVGISTHMVAGVKGALEFGNIDVIHPLFNYMGWGISDGSIEDMCRYINLCYEKGIGIYGMKIFGGGNLIESSEKALNFGLEQKSLSSIAIGMHKKTEIDANISFFKNRSFGTENKKELAKINRHLHIENWCDLCQKCVNRCKNKALSIENDKVKVDKAKCVLCSYCSTVCENMCMKVL
jgi:aryl-alcohol dehydrogenase-like predicted oxidoreductase